MDKGTCLKQLRERTGITQTEAARHIGISKQTLYKYENNVITNIPSDVIERMARLYETTPAFIMGWENPEQQIREAYYKGGIRRTITDREVDLIILYRAASRDIQTAIDKILGLENAEKRDIG